MTRTAQRRGFVLVLALALIAIVGLLLCAVARQSLRHSLEAIESQHDLQRRWGSISAQQVFLGHASEIFPSRTEDESATSRRMETVESPMAFTVELGGIRFKLVLADEDAKVNLNTVIAGSSLGSVRNVVQTLGRRRWGGDLRIVLRPGRISPNDPLSKAFETWEQVFDVGSNDQTTGIVAIPNLTGTFTCWGGGKLNIHRASPEAIQTLCGTMVGGVPTDRLLALRQLYPDAKLSQVLDQLQLRERQRAQMEEVLTDHSTCFSMWISMNSDKGRWSEFHIVNIASDVSDSDSDSGNSGLKSIGDFTW